MTLRDVPHRTTLTLDDDVAAKLARETRRTGRPYRAIVNEALRRGLEAVPTAPGAFAVDARPMRQRARIDIDDVAGLLDQLDGPREP